MLGGFRHLHLKEQVIHERHDSSHCFVPPVPVTRIIPYSVCWKRRSWGAKRCLATRVTIGIHGHEGSLRIPTAAGWRTSRGHALHPPGVSSLRGSESADRAGSPRIWGDLA